MRNVKGFRDEDQVIQFLSGLNDSFSIVRTQILLMDPLPHLNKVYSLVAQEESHEGLHVTDDSKALINAVEIKKPYGRDRGYILQGGRGKGLSPQYTFCGRSGYTIDSYYRKHGFPPNYVNGKNFNSNANSLQAQDYDESCKGFEEMNISGSLPAFTKEQYDNILALIQSSKAAPPQPSVNQVSVSTGHTSDEAFVSGIPQCFFYLFHIVWLVPNQTPGY